MAAGGKGHIQRPYDIKKFDQEWERIFRQDIEKEDLPKVTEEDLKHYQEEMEKLDEN